MKRFYPLIVLFLLSNLGFSQVFVEVNTKLKGVIEPVAEWIDLPGSKHYGIWLSGDTYKNNYHYVLSQLNKYKDKNNFITGFTNLPAVYNGSSASGDYDKDGDLDIIISGYDKDNTAIMHLYKNVGAYKFVEVSQSFRALTDGSLCWGDYDNDGDLDILATGRDANNVLATIIYRNDGGYFTETVTGIPGVYFGNAEWGYFDSDQYLDIVITGDIGGAPFSAVYLYRNGKYKKLNQRLVPLKHSMAKFGDLDNDEDIDIILSGEDEYGYPLCKVYSNVNGVLVEIPTAIRSL